MGAHIFMDAVRWIGRLFHKSAAGDTSVKDAVEKGVDALNQVLDKFDEFKPLIEIAISDEGVGSIEAVEAEIKAARDKFAEVESASDITGLIVDIKLAEDPKRNEFYHSLLNLTITAFGDGKIDIAEFSLILATVINFFRPGIPPVSDNG